jgi:site-specific recombinase XerD
MATSTLITRECPTVVDVACEPVHGLSLSDYFDCWLSGKADATKDVYTRVATSFARSLPRDIDSLTNIRRPHITQYIDTARALKDANGNTLLVENTIRLKVATLKSLFRYLADEQLIPRNPTIGIKVKPEEEPLNKRILKRDEVLRIISFAREGREKALIRVLYHTGMRISECLSMRWENITYTEHGADIIVTGKGGHKRMVTLRADDLLLLREINPEEWGFMFSTRTGGALSRTGAHRHMKSACSRAGLKKPVSCHWCRHAMISHSIRGGQGRKPKPISVVSRDVGHRSRAMTLRYDQPDEDELFCGLDL